MAFNPIKEEKEGTRSQRVVWTTETLEKAVKGLNQGRVLSVNPFYDNKVWLLKEDLTYQRTPEEIREWKKCAKDVLYFAQKYAKLLTPEGIKHVTLRDYQVEYLKFLSENRLTIFLSARQSGKCFDFLTTVYVKDSTDERIKKSIGDRYFNKKLNCYILPFFELYDIFTEHNLLWKIKYRLFKIIQKLKGNTIDPDINVVSNIMSREDIQNKMQ